MQKFYSLIVAIFGLAILNTALAAVFYFFDIQREYYNEYMNWVNMMIIFVVILPDTRGELLNKLMV